MASPDGPTSINSFIRTDFTTLLHTLGQPKKKALPNTDWPTALITRYTEPHRYYHTPTHLYSMLQCLSRHAALVQDDTAIRLAIYFHDWVYDPKRGDNEARSVDCFRDFCEGRGVGAGLAAKVARWIACTVGHVVPEGDGDGDGDLKLFLDFDLEVLGRGKADYADYAERIRREYAHFSQGDYCAGRILMLKGLLGRERLYFSEEFLEECEGRARENMTWEIRALEEMLKAVENGS